MTEAQLRDLPAYEESAAFSPLEKLVLDYAVAMTETPVEVPEALLPGYESTSPRRSSSS